MTTRSTDELAKIVWEYHHLHHKLKKCEAIFVLGSSDTRVAEYAAELFLRGLGDYLIFSGGLGNLTRDRFKKPEAEVFADIAIKLGVPRDKMLQIAQNIPKKVWAANEELIARGYTRHLI
jgi:hypothetical protein